METNQGVDIETETLIDTVLFGGSQNALALQQNDYEGENRPGSVAQSNRLGTAASGRSRASQTPKPSSRREALRPQSRQ